MKYASKKMFSVFCKNEKRSTSVFSVCQNDIASKTCFLYWYMKNSSKTCIKILATWKALHKHVFSLSKRNRFENVFFHFVREKTFKNIFLILLTWKALRKRALPICKTCSLVHFSHENCFKHVLFNFANWKNASKTYLLFVNMIKATKCISDFCVRWKTIQKRNVSFCKY